MNFLQGNHCNLSVKMAWERSQNPGVQGPPGLPEDPLKYTDPDEI